MYRTLIIVALLAGAVACSGSADVDPSTALPGTWHCDDEITLILAADGRYEWHVKHDEDYSLYTESNDVMKMTDEGHVLLGQWRVDGDTLELDMLGETDRYSLSFSSRSRMRIDGPERYGCKRD